MLQPIKKVRHKYNRGKNKPKTAVDMKIERIMKLRLTSGCTHFKIDDYIDEEKCFQDIARFRIKMENLGYDITEVNKTAFNSMSVMFVQTKFIGGIFR